MDRRGICGVIVMAAGLVWPSAEAAAQGPGAVRLGLNSAFYVSESTTLTVPDRFVDPGGGSGSMDFDMTNVRLGIGGPALGADLGFVASTQLVVGGRLAWSSVTAESDEREIGSGSSFMLLPYLEFMPGTPGATVRAAMTVMLGYMTSSTTSFDSSGDTTFETSTSGLAFGASIGMHVFGTPTFTVSPSFGVIYSTGSTESGSGGSSSGDSIDSSVLTVLLAVELAGWMGGQPPETAPGLEPGAAPAPGGGQWTAPTAGSAPLAPPVLPAHAITGSVPLSRGNIELLGSWQTPDMVQLRIHAFDMQPRFRDCMVVRLWDGVAEGEIARTDYAIAPLASGVDETITVVVQRSLLERMHAGPRAGVALCGQAYELDARGKSALGYFLTRIREEATRHGTLGTPAPAPEPLPPPAAPPDAQPEPAPPPAQDQLWQAPPGM
jgi:hypothetical protein